MTIQEAIKCYLAQIKRSKSPHTLAAYRQGIATFVACLAEEDPPINVTETDVAALSPLWLETFLNQMQHRAVST